VPWNPGQIDSQILAVHAALVPTGAQGEVVLFGGDEHWSAQQESAGDNSWKKTRIYDVATHSIVPGQTQSPDSDVFCSHHAFIGDGRLLIAGGTSEWPVDGDAHMHNLDFLGHSRCWLYNPRQRQWVETTRLNRNPDQPDVARSGGRWYPGLTALGDGSVVAFFGHLDEDDFRHRNNTPERFFPSSQSWALLPHIIGNYGEPDTGGRRFLFFPRAYVLPSGKIFSATPLPPDFAAQMDGSDGPHFSTAFDADTGLYTTPRANAPDGVDTAWNFPAVLLPLLPHAGGYNARLLYWNGPQPRWIDTDAASPQWTDTAARDAAVAARQRVYGQMVVLPTGQVCAVGGVNVVNPEDPVNQAEIYTPDIDWTTNSYGSGGGAWMLDTANSAINNRNYHSVGLLLPNGKVWVSGGDTNASSGDPNVVGVKKIELYEPPYVAVANRIVLQSAPSLLGYGQAFDVVLDRAATNVGRAALIRNGSVTHSTNNDQRYVGLEIVSRTGNSIRLTAPPNGNVAPPGYYMLWLVDNGGNPCQLARFVRLAHLSCRVIADRSTFSEEEVQALGGGADADFGSALYVDFDGFIATELSGTPGFSLAWSDGSGAVSASDVTLQFAGRFSETDPPSPDVPTRITFAFDILFPTMNGFAGWLDRREITITFQLGAHSCQARVALTKSPNPYMIDIDPAVHNPAWLSTDVRVFKVRPNQTLFGATLSMSGTGPWDYIRAVIDRLRSGAESFTSIPSSGPDTTLDGAYMSGMPLLPTFNFAVAHVRYRATTTPASQVRCFFRICNAAATGLGFDTSTVYQSTPGPNPVPLLGVAGGQLVSIPFVNAPRINTISGQAGAAGLDTQPLHPTYDIQDIMPQASGAEVSAYFGCYLDINTPTKRFPAAPSGNGPFPDSASLPIRDLLRSWHNCLVAEIVFAGDPTTPGAGPSDSDNLAQRNLAIVGLENPGLSASRTAMHTFEVAPSPLRQGEPIFSPTRPQAEGPASFVAGTHQRVHPDELFFDWRGLPAGTEATLYFSDVDTADIEALLAGRISPAAFTALDRHTIRFRIGDCAWLPLPGGREVRIPALISIALPDGIVEGQVYRVAIRQVDGRTGRIVGSVTIEMPVSKAAFLRPEAERQLSFMGHIAVTLAPLDRWRPLIERLVAHLAARVDALGGNSSNVSPNPDGTGKPYRASGWRPGQPFPSGGFHSGPEAGDGSDEDCLCWPGWGVAAALALALVALGMLPPAAALLVAVLAVLAIALCGYCWSHLCRGRFLCRLLDKLVLGAVAATGVLALGAAFFGAAVNLPALALSGVTALVAIAASYLLRCRGGCCD
jgi:hypothetical protein